jgi:superfamily II DNA or RNA helicase/HKD family nuclease
MRFLSHAGRAFTAASRRADTGEVSRWRRPELVPGIYDEIVTGSVEAKLAKLAATLGSIVEPLGASSDVTAALAATLRDVIEAALDEHSSDPERAIALASELLAAVRRHAPKVATDLDVTLTHARLRSIIEKPATEIARPLGSLHRSSLIANAEGDQLLDHLRSEFDSADYVELLCAFVKLSGVEKLRRELERHCVGRGRRLRVLTTTYMGASDQAAIDRLARLPNAQVKISYDEEVTRLHAKAWLFHRHSGVSTAYVGSSNLSHAAQTDGLEWNVRISESEQPAVVAQIRETFEQYWEDAHQFESYDPSAEPQRIRLARALSPSARREDVSPGVIFELEAKAHQKPVLEELAAARQLGRHRNLLVAATGTGKTVMAALDYAELRRAKAVDSLLFVAHRREILEQSISVFRSALQLQDFGELLHQYEKPVIGRHVFASIDSLGEGAVIDASTFDMVILDEAHHASAETWDALLRRIRPRELLGLTGTPERADGLNYEHHFPRPWVGNLRLWNAIPNALVPFRYYMLDVDGVDLRDVRWSRGGYVNDELSRTLIDAADIFVSRAIRALRDHIGRPDEIRAIAFCTDKSHAEAVAARFAREGYTTGVLNESTPRHERRDARRNLDAGRIQILCVVDLYNEGVDVPNVNTLFFFRPTESATVFLQQLGRGLRRTTTKPELVVFDLTGRHRLEFRFDRRLRATLGHTPRELRDFVETGSGRLPSGCHFHFDELARQDVLDQLKRAVPSDVRGIREMLRDPSHVDLGLARFLEETDVELDDLYGNDRGWTLLRQGLHLDKRPLADGERDALEAVPKLLHVGDELRLDAWTRASALERPTSERDRRLVAMLFVVLYGKRLAATEDAWMRWATHDVLRSELAELVPILRQRNGLLPHPHELEPDVPLRLHAHYLGAELSAAFDQRSAKGEFRDYYTGVERAGDARYDLLLVTLEKSAAKKEHLKYRDFPLNEHRFHWQSKARTTRASREGRRHLDPAGEGCVPLLFVRAREDDRPGITAAFQYLGPVSPDGDEGERPISIEWRLHFAMPSSLVARGRVAA